MGVGLAVSAGFAGVFVAVGSLVALGLRQVVAVVPWAAVGIGGLLVALGVALAAGREVGLRLGTGLGAGPGGSAGRLVAVGAAYAVASLSCTLGVLLAVVAQATATATPAQTLGVFATYATGAATVLVAVAVAVALAKARLVRVVRRALPNVTRLGGVLLVVSGGYLVAYWLPALRGGAPAGWVAGLSEAPSAVLTGVLDTDLARVGALAAAVLAAGTLLGVWRQRRRAANHTPVPVVPVQPPADDCCAQPPATTTQTPTTPCQRTRDHLTEMPRVAPACAAWSASAALRQPTTPRSRRGTTRNHEHHPQPRGIRRPPTDRRGASGL